MDQNGESEAGKSGLPYSCILAPGLAADSFNTSLDVMKTAVGNEEFKLLLLSQGMQRIPEEGSWKRLKVYMYPLKNSNIKKSTVSSTCMLKHDLHSPPSCGEDQ